MARAYSTTNEERIARLPKWAQRRIKRLEQPTTREAAQTALTEISKHLASRPHCPEAWEERLLDGLAHLIAQLAPTKE